MLNLKPIFISCLSRGGSSVLLNILRSHPDVCSPRGETHEVFIGKGDERFSTILMKRLAYLPIMLLQREHVFSARRFEIRRYFSSRASIIIDRVLFQEKMMATDATQNRFRAEDVKYTQQELAKTRLLCKNIDALVFLTPNFSRIYPDATFFGLVRNGLAICEGQVRRGKNAAAYGRRYALTCEQMLADAKRISDFHLLRYESLTEDTLGSASDIYRRANLDESQLEKFRLVVGADGRTGGDADRLRWYRADEFAAEIRPSFDDEQIGKLSQKDRNAFLHEAGSVMKKLGYL